MKLSITPDKTWPKTGKEPRGFRIAVAGSHFVSLLIAAALRETGSVTLAELGSPRAWLALNLEERFKGRCFTDYTETLAAGGPIRLLSNLEENVNWIVRKPGSPPASGTDLYRLAFGLPGDFVVLDLSGAGEDDVIKLAADSDGAVLVCDPLPSRLLSDYRFTDRFRLTLPKAAVVVNRMNQGVHKGALKRFLSGADYVGLPYIDPVFIYRAEYSASLPWNVPQIRAAAGPAISEILARLGIKAT